MNRFELLFIKHNIDLRSAWLTNDVAMTKNATGTVVLTTCKRLTRQETIVGVAMMLGVLELGWDGMQFRFRFPIPEEDPVLKAVSRRKVRRDYRKALKWAANYLITDRMLMELRAEGRQPWELCEQESVTPELVACRLGVILPDDVLEYRARESDPFFYANL